MFAVDCDAVMLRFHLGMICGFHGVSCRSSNCGSDPWLQVGTAKVDMSGCEKLRNVGWSSSIVGTTGSKEMYSVSVSRSKVLRLLVVDLH